MKQAQIICPVCEIKISTLELPQGKNAHCPRCDTQLYRGSHKPLRDNLFLALTGLLFLIPCLFFPFVTIRLFNINFSANLVSGSYALMKESSVILGFIVLFCSVLTPLIVFGTVITAHWGLTRQHFTIFKYSLLIFQRLKHWMMLDVFLLGIAIAFFKLSEYATITPKMGLACIFLTQIVTIFLLSRLSVSRYWQRWQSSEQFQFDDVQTHCHHCHLSQPESQSCVRCGFIIHKRKPNSIQKTWAFLITAAILILPANLLYISIFYSNGKRYEDTIFSGVISFVKSGMPEIAFIIFVASIAVPIAKIIGLIYILIGIQFKHVTDYTRRMKIYLFVKWIGKWSILDLYVIAITIALVDRDQILDFLPGPAAIAFAGVVILTMLAAESLDPRLIWDDSASNTPQKESLHEK
ncbi:paraquat-inducible protein A [Vibrio algicola]|uniref:PqiA/YebS family transporter subunit n=1 Tax=Vibrio algicola TaxID=2662262 RepID=A0A5Q0TIK8_9VIBR|nr:paraquat-inducible protein A [Vibrio algicola]